MDSIANMLTIIRNAQMARHTKVAVPYSAMNLLLVKILQKEKINYQIYMFYLKLKQLI